MVEKKDTQGTGFLLMIRKQKAQRMHDEDEHQSGYETYGMYLVPGTSYDDISYVPYLKDIEIQLLTIHFPRHSSFFASCVPSSVARTTGCVWYAFFRPTATLCTYVTVFVSMPTTVCQKGIQLEFVNSTWYTYMKLNCTRYANK